MDDETKREILDTVCLIFGVVLVSFGSSVNLGLGLGFFVIYLKPWSEK